MIGQQSEFALVGESGNGPDLIAAVTAAQPDVVVMDMLTPGSACMAKLQNLQAVLPQARWVLLADSADIPLVRRVLAAGAHCVLLKTASQQEFLDALHCATRGIPMCSAELRPALQPVAPGVEPGADLTQRERELLALLARGLGNGDISARLAIAVPTVKFHITNIMSKLQAANRTAAVLVALRHNIVQLD